jgi:hypothetical protein
VLKLVAGAGIYSGMNASASTNPQRVYRVDRFRVPAPARTEFLEQVRATHDVLRTQPGLIQEFVLEQAGGPDAFNFVTVVVWRDAEALGQARNVILEHRRSTGFDPNELFARWKIEADMGNYAEAAL